MVVTRFRPILQKFADHGADVIVVGGVAALIHAAPILTFDLDLVHSREPANLQRVLAALHEIDAYYRLQSARHLCPNESHLASPGHHLLMTDFGPLDLLGTIGNKRSYEDLLPDSTIEVIEARPPDPRRWPSNPHRHQRRGWTRKRLGDAPHPPRHSRRDPPSPIGAAHHL